MGLLKDLISHLKEKDNEDPELIEKLEKAGKDDADRIAEEMGQTTRKEVSPRVDVSNLPPIEMPVAEKEEHEVSDNDGR